MILKLEQLNKFFKFFLIILLVSSFLFSSVSQAQNVQLIDSLTRLILHNKVHDTIKIKAYNDLGIQYAYTNPNLARTYINSALNLATKIDVKRGVAGAYNCLGVVDYYQKNYDSALLNFKKALGVNIELEHLWGQAAALNQIGAVQNLKNDYNAAIKNFQKAGGIFKTMKDTLALAKSLQNIGLSYSSMANHKISTEYYLKAINLYKLINNQEGIARGYISISTILYKQEDYKKSLKYLNEAFLILKSSSNVNLLGVISKKMGSCYSQLKDYNKALDYFEDALEYKKNNNNKKSIRYIQFDIGNTYYKMKQYNKALIYQKEALQKYELNSHNLSRARIHNAISKTYIELNQLKEAKNYAVKALEISKSVEDLKEQKYAYYALAMIAKQQGKNGKALELFMNYEKLNDSLLVQENQQYAKELTTIYETEKRDIQIENQKKDIAILDAQHETKNQFLFFGGVGLISIFGFILLFKSRNTAKKEKMLQELFSQNLITEQEKERTRVARELHDSVGQKLMLLAKKTKIVANKDLVALSENTLEELRAISRGLHPPTIEGLGVTQAIIAMINEVDKHSNIFFTNDIENIDNLLSKEDALHVYRIIQEVLNNIVKHANANTTFITVEKKKAYIKMSIEDNGNGFDFSKELNKNVSLGMKTLRERAKIIKSKLEIKTEPQKGTVVKLIIPYTCS